MIELISNENEEEYDNCCICLEKNDENSIQLTCNCGNKFHVNCINKMKKYEINTCPICCKNITINTNTTTICDFLYGCTIFIYICILGILGIIFCFIIITVFMYIITILYFLYQVCKYNIVIIYIKTVIIIKQKE